VTLSKGYVDDASHPPRRDAGLEHGSRVSILQKTVRWMLGLDAGSIALGGLLLWFAAANLRVWVFHPQALLGLGGTAGIWRALSSTAAVALELLQGVLFFVRRRDTGGRRPIRVWIAATAGSWTFLLTRPIGVAAGYFGYSGFPFTGNPLFGRDPVWFGLQLAGAVLAMISLWSLGRSFGLLAANRGVRTAGPYRVVRHPAYASYFIEQLGYVLENFTLWNAAILCVVVVAQLCRIAQEEAVLSHDAAYQRYCREVRYRLIPGIY
jgi:hypothetical protein